MLNRANEFFKYCVSFVVIATTIAIPAASFAEDIDEKVTIVAQGVGLNQDAALRNAYNNAIHQAIGVYVDAETIAKNDQIIKDQVLTHSRGLIKEFEKISQSEEGGLVHVTIRASVFRQPLIDRVEPILESVVEFDGNNLHAGLVTKEQQAEDAQALLDKAIDRIFRTSIFSFSIDGELEYTETNNTLYVPVKAETNLDLYKKLREEFALTLEQIANEREDIIITGITERDNVGDGYLHRKSKVRMNLESEVKLVMVQVWQNPDGTQSKWRGYHVPGKCKVPPYLVAQIEIQIFDKEGSLLAIGKKALDRYNFSGLHGGFYDSCYYTQNIWHSRVLAKNLTFKAPVKVEKYMLPEIKEVKVKVSYLSQ